MDMLFTRNMRLVSAGVALFFSNSLASPTYITRSSLLHQRSIDSYNGCSAEQKEKLEQDFADATSFSLHAYNDLTETSPA